MTGDEVRTWLEAELKSFPDRATQVEFYGYFLRRVGDVIDTERPNVVAALAHWLRSHSEPRTTLALEIAEAYRLDELRPELERLLQDVSEGKALLPYYSRYIRQALDAI